MNIDFDAMLATVEAEAKRFETTRDAVLMTFDGRPVHAPEEQATKEAQFLGPVREAVAAVHEAAQLAHQQAAVVMTTVDADPLAGASNEELQRMNLLSNFVRDEVEDMVIPELQKRLQWAVNHADNATRRLLVKYASKRISGPGGERLITPLRSLEDSLISPAERAKRAKAIEQAQELQQKAQQASFAAEERLRRADGRAAAAYAQRVREYGGKM